MWVRSPSDETIFRWCDLITSKFLIIAKMLSLITEYISQSRWKIACSPRRQCRVFNCRCTIGKDYQQPKGTSGLFILISMAPRWYDCGYWESGQNLQIVGYKEPIRVHSCTQGKDGCNQDRQIRIGWSIHGHGRTSWLCSRVWYKIWLFT